MADPIQSPNDRLWLILISAVSVAIVAVAVFIVYGPRLITSGTKLPLDISNVPALNATLNGVAAILLLLAFIAIRKSRINVHRALILSALTTSTIFLVSYLIYHAFKEEPRAYTGSIPVVYYPLLISHITLAISIVPLALITLYHGWQAPNNRLARRRHRRIARITFPVWLYVSVTGVIVFAMLELHL